MVDSDVCLTVSDISDNGRHQVGAHTKSYTASDSILWTVSTHDTLALSIEFMLSVFMQGW
jgi:hypothetical protein